MATAEEIGAASVALPPSPSPSVAASPYYRPRQEDQQVEGGFSPFVAFCFTINYILGTGFLTIPWAFVQGGLALSAGLLLTCCLVADMSKDYILETMARAEAMVDERMRWKKGNKNAADDQAGGKVTVPSSKVATVVAGGVSVSPLVYSPMIPMGGSSGGPGTEESTPLALTAPAGKIRREHSYSSFLDKEPAKNDLFDMETTKREEVRGRRLVRMPPTKHTATAAGSSNQKYIVRNERKFELNTLSRIFLGRRGKDVYLLVLAIYIYCTLWAYTSVFASAMARQFTLPLGNISFLQGSNSNGDTAESASYVLYALAFGAVVVPMSCMELHEQIAVQVFLTGCRFLMVGLMVFTCQDVAANQGDNDSDVTVPIDSIPWFRPSGLHKMLPIMVFATIYHHSIPGLSHPVKDKKQLSPIFIATTAFCASAYTFIGFVLGSTFGDGIEQSANLNWSSYGAGVGGSSGWWKRAISLYIICFPALDVLSAFPLNAITLGNNMLGAFYGRRIHEVENNRWVRTRFRLVAAIPSIFLAILVRELGTITDYAGTAGFILTFSFPALLYICSRRQACRRNFSQDTFYTSYASSYFLASLVFIFGIGMVLFCVVQEIKGSSS